MIDWTLETLTGTTLLMAAVMALRGPVARHFGPRLAYAMWLLPALRMVLPPLPGWQALYAPVFDLSPERTTVGLTDPLTAADLARAATLETPAFAGPGGAAAMAASSPAFDWPALLLALWIGGAALWFGWQMLRYRRFLARAAGGATLLTRICNIDVLVSPYVAGPMAAGILHRRILLPADFMHRYTPAERRLALLHEGAHHDRRDILANLAALAIVALHWWNPVAHLAYRAFRRDQELACDATVLDGAEAEARADYGTALVKSASSGTPAVACALNSKAELAQRIRMMAAKKVGRARLLCGATLTMGAIAGGLLVTASGGTAAPAAAGAPAARPAVPALPALPMLPEEADMPVPEAPIAPEAPRAPAAPRPHHPHVAVPAMPRPPVAPLPPAPPAPLDAAAVAGHVEAAMTHAEQAHASAMIDAERARARAQAAATHAAAAHLHAGDVHAQVEASLAATRTRMAADCAARGTPVQPGASWARLATCDGAFKRDIRLSLAHSRAAVAHSTRLSAEARAEALADIEDAAAEVDDIEIE